MPHNGWRMRFLDESVIRFAGAQEQRFFVTRETRNRFLSEIAENTTNLPGMIYAASERPAGGVNVLTVVFGLEWPKKRGQPVDSKNLYESARLQAIASEIFRVKDFLERRLLTEVNLLDIRIGCVRVRYAIEGQIDRSSVHSAMRSLLDHRDLYSVTSVSGNVDGRAVNP
jgi:hypothetical protein